MNPPTREKWHWTQESSMGTVCYIIRNFRKQKYDRSARFISSTRHRFRSAGPGFWKLYLKCGKRRYFGTSDEAMFYLGGSYGIVQR
ncbi:hypothetical protein DPMN_020281 [Dreissena polymorpha]|uniref:Uncharacterized protein n=1 Tax=Dreissena polymorpha TaxID=45954 RepID=A0A9D4NK38_DREPO|nr:hypothetical protein DPMN_020281 [Dreissena polymorpha]